VQVKYLAIVQKPTSCQRESLFEVLVAVQDAKVAVVLTVADKRLFIAPAT
jgi:hypothetical protein